ncbi:hypothetical protein FJZ53_01855 [Candidatus Woesearchaeota archaeon]|nr:hypothetical protein [Candidatus Woesearchaeota archaeon]
MKLSIKDMHNFASRMGGRCLSSKYVSVRNKLTWQCKEGHVLKATPQVVRKNYLFCPSCAWDRRLAEKQARRIAKQKDKEYFKQKRELLHLDWVGRVINELKELAQRRGGECLSDKYVKGSVKLTWKCKNGHIWDADIYTIRRGRWCPHCCDKEKASAMFKERETLFKMARETPLPKIR